MTMRPKIAVFGNCQAPAVESLLRTHPPFMDRFELRTAIPIHLMTEEDKQAFHKSAAALDILVMQFLEAHFGCVSTEGLAEATAARRIEFPSLWFNGHLVDSCYFRDESGSKFDDAPFGYSSLVVASAAARGLDEAAAVDLMLNPDTVPPEFVWENYAAGLAELKWRERRCQIFISDLIDRVGPSRRLFHTMNHPALAVILHIANQLLALLDVEPIEDNGDLEDGLTDIVWPVLDSVAKTVGLPPQHDFKFGPADMSLAEFVQVQYAYYRAKPDVLTTNAHMLDPAWLVPAISSY